MFMLRKWDWNLQKPCIILLAVHKLVQEKGATKPETPASQPRIILPDPTLCLFQKKLINNYSQLFEVITLAAI
ncbi:MAG: hypothetical protein ACKN9A_01600, partial [Microcystis aeruginosa]